MHVFKTCRLPGVKLACVSLLMEQLLLGPVYKVFCKSMVLLCSVKFKLFSMIAQYNCGSIKQVGLLGQQDVGIQKNSALR